MESVNIIIAVVEKNMTATVCHAVIFIQNLLDCQFVVFAGADHVSRPFSLIGGIIGGDADIFLSVQRKPRKEEQGDGEVFFH